MVDEAEQILTKLRKAHRASESEINKAVLKCVAYRTDRLRTDGAEPVLTVGWNPAQNIADARDSLNYRIGALVWNLRLLKEKQFEEATKVSQLKIARKVAANETRNALITTGYIFDDVVFNAVSVFDYLAMLIFRVNLPDLTGRNRDWRWLAKNTNKLMDQELGCLILSVNERWFKALDKLRGHLIHTKAEVGGLEIRTHLRRTGLEHEFDFQMPKKALEDLPIFDGESKISLEPGTALIALESVQSVRQIVDILGNFEYDCVHDPFSNA